MFPVLLDFGTHDLPALGPTHLFLPSYGLLFALGALAAWGWFSRRARAMGLSGDAVFNLAFYTLLGGVLGAKLTLVLLDFRFYLEHPRLLLGTLRIAGVLMGGVVVGAAVFTIYARRKGLPLLRLADAIAAPLALAQGVGRLGCFSAGCCWGRPTSGPLHTTFTDPVAHAQTGVPLDTALVPTQLLQMTNDLTLALVLTLLWRRRLEPEGTVFWIYVLLYSITRGVIEFWRGDVSRGLYLGGQVSTSQLFALAGAAFALVMLFRARRGATADV